MPAMTLSELLCSFFSWMRDSVCVSVCGFWVIRLLTSASLLSSLLSTRLKYQSEACTRHPPAICDQISFRDLLSGRLLQDFRTFCSNSIFFPGSRLFSSKWIPSSFWGCYTSKKQIVLSVLKNSWISRSVCNRRC